MVLSPARKGRSREDPAAGEDRARRALIESGVLKVVQQCQYCGQFMVRKVVRRDRYRCRECGKEWGLKKGSILEETKVSYKTFFDLVRLYADDVPVNEAATRLGVTRNMASELYFRIQAALPENTNDGSLVNLRKQTSPASSGRRGPVTQKTPNHTVIFGIRSQSSTVVIEPVENPSPEMIMALPIPTMQRGNILFIDVYGKKYQGFITYDLARQGKEIVRIRPRSGISWSPLSEFWTFTGTSWARRQGVDRKSMPEYIRELAFRFNHRHTDLFPVILERIAQTEYRKIHQDLDNPHPVSA